MLAKDADVKGISFASQFRSRPAAYEKFIVYSAESLSLICPNLYGSNLVMFFGPVPAPNLYVMLGPDSCAEKRTADNSKCGQSETQRLGLFERPLSDTELVVLGSVQIVLGFEQCR
jgi:hypothetical protein